MIMQYRDVFSIVSLLHDYLFANVNYYLLHLPFSFCIETPTNLISDVHAHVSS